MAEHRIRHGARALFRAIAGSRLAIAAPLTGLADRLGMLPLIGGQRAADVVGSFELALVVPTDVALGRSCKPVVEPA